MTRVRCQEGAKVKHHTKQTQKGKHEMALTDEIQTALSDLRASVPEITGAVIASTDGLAIAHSVSSGDPNRMAAMVATSLGLGKRISENFGGGNLNETSVVGENALISVYSAGPKGVLAVVASSGANIGMVNLESRETAKKVQGILN